MADPWTRSQIALLSKLWNDDGLTASQCAAVIGVSRNAVIGKVHREKYPKRRPHTKVARRVLKWSPEAMERSRQRSEARRAQKVKKMAAKVIPTPPPEVFKPAAEDLAVGAWSPLPNTTPIGLMDLSDKVCRWPVSDGAPFLFCGCATADGSSYCPTHKHIGAGKGTIGEQNAVKAAKGAAKQDRNHKAWLEAA